MYINYTVIVIEISPIKIGSFTVCYLFINVHVYILSTQNRNVLERPSSSRGWREVVNDDKCTCMYILYIIFLGDSGYFNPFKLKFYLYYVIRICTQNIKNGFV